MDPPNRKRKATPDAMRPMSRPKKAKTAAGAHPQPSPASLDIFASMRREAASKTNVRTPQESPGQTAAQAHTNTGRQQNINPKAAQTSILDDDAAIRLGDAQKTAKRGSIAKGIDFVDSAPPSFTVAHNHTDAAPKKPRAPRAPRATAPKAPTGPVLPEFYVTDSLKIPLNQKNGRRKNKPRQAKTIQSKMNKSELLALVEEYAGKLERDVREASKATTKDICEWIEQVETEALNWAAEVDRLGNDPANSPQESVVSREPSVAPYKTEVVPKKTDKQHERPIGRPHTAATMAAKSITEASATTKAARSLRTQTSADNPHDESGANKGTRVHNSSTPDVNTSEPTNGRGGVANSHARNGTFKPKSAMSPRRLKIPRKELIATPKQQTTALDVTPWKKTSVDDSEEELPSSRSDDDDLEALVKAGLMEESDEEDASQQESRPPKVKPHRAIKCFGLEPGNLNKSTVVMDLPKKRGHAIIMAKSKTEVHETFVPYREYRDRPKRSQPAPFLKPGVHGFVGNEFKGDPDLETGVGHQIDPADQARLDCDPSFKREFEEKYPGMGAHLWRCGCSKPWDDAWSEAES